ncbi:MAG TPA: hypothetical protein VFQ45_00485, partial [Longimicrobium sp.]|nr:hypothetical protein [Longimicrobium sp.]
MQSSSVAPDAGSGRQTPEEGRADALWSRAAGLAARLLDVPAVLIVPPEAADRAVRTFPAMDDWPPELRAAVRGLCGRLAETGEPLWLGDVPGAAAGAFAGVPLPCGGGTGGALCVADLRT